MAIVKVDPFRELTAMQDRMARLFGDVYLRDEGTFGRALNTLDPPELTATAFAES